MNAYYAKLLLETFEKRLDIEVGQRLFDGVAGRSTSTEKAECVKRLGAKLAKEAADFIYDFVKAVPE